MGAAEYARHQAQEQALAERDAAAHEASHGLKQASGALAIVGLGCLLVGCLFPPALLVGAVALELTEATLVVGVAIDHPTQDNWVTVGSDVLVLFSDLVTVGVGLKAGEVLRGKGPVEDTAPAKDTPEAVTEEPMPAKPEIKPYSNPLNRPAYGSKQVQDAWDAAKQSDGKVYDPNTGEELNWDTLKSRAGQWNMGYLAGKEFRKLHEDYMSGKISKEEFLR